MRKKWAERNDEQEVLHGKGPQANDSIQMAAKTIIDKARTIRYDDDHAKDAKSLVCEVAQDEGKSRKRLREELHEQARASRRRLWKDDCSPEQPKKKPKRRIEGNDAITRLLNIGRPHQVNPHEGTMSIVVNGNRLMHAGTDISRATEGVVASSSIVVPGVL